MSIYKFINKAVLLISLLASFSLQAQTPSGIDPDADNQMDTGMNLVWKVVIFAGVPLILLAIYLIFRNKK